VWNRNPEIDRQTGNKSLIREFKGLHEFEEALRVLAEIVYLVRRGSTEEGLTATSGNSLKTGAHTGSSHLFATVGPAVSFEPAGLKAHLPVQLDKQAWLIQLDCAFLTQRLCQIATTMARENPLFEIAPPGRPNDHNAAPQNSDNGPTFCRAYPLLILSTAVCKLRGPFRRWH
jgi:uncharacterized protein (DUF58 family)